MQKPQTDSKSNTDSGNVPCVGLYWYEGDAILEFYRESIDSASADEIAIDVTKGHINYWQEKALKHKYGREYDHVPRGRILFNKYSNRYIVYFGEPLSALLKSELIELFNLPSDKTIFEYDAHYKTYL